MGNKGTEWVSTDSGDSVTFPLCDSSQIVLPLGIFCLTNGNNDNVFGVRFWEVRTRTWKAFSTAAWQDHA